MMNELLFKEEKGEIRGSGVGASGRRGSRYFYYAGNLEKERGCHGVQQWVCRLVLSPALCSDAGPLSPRSRSLTHTQERDSD